MLLRITICCITGLHAGQGGAYVAGRTKTHTAELYCGTAVTMVNGGARRKERGNCTVLYKKGHADTHRLKKERKDSACVSAYLWEGHVARVQYQNGVLSKCCRAFRKPLTDAGTTACPPSAAHVLCSTPSNFAPAPIPMQGVRGCHLLAPAALPPSTPPLPNAMLHSCMMIFWLTHHSCMMIFWLTHHSCMMIFWLTHHSCMMIFWLLSE
jgi:hypothetical protein